MRSNMAVTHGVESSLRSDRPAELQVIKHPGHEYSDQDDALGNGHHMTGPNALKKNKNKQT